MMKGKNKEILTVSAIFLQKFATALANVAWLVLLAELIDEALPQEGIMRNQEKMAQYVLGLILLSVWKRMGYNLGRYLTLKLQNIVCFRMKSRMVEKISKIPYRLLEDYAFSELKQALQGNIGGSSGRTIVWFLVQKSGNFMLYCVKLLGICLLLGRAAFPLGCLFFLLEAADCIMNVLGEKDVPIAGDCECSLEKRYMDELALGHSAAAERSLFSYIGYIGKRSDREEEGIQKEAFEMSMEREKKEFAEGVLAIITCVLTELGLTALMAGGRISTGYFIAMSMGVCGLTQNNEEGDLLRFLKTGKLFLGQWNRFMNLPETEEDGAEIRGRSMGEKGKTDEGMEKGSRRDNSTDEIRKLEEVGYVPEECMALEFRNVSFRYPRTGRYVLHDLSFRLTKGGYYAFVGSNGSGKTTMVNLLSGFYDTYEGEIRLNGIELREIPFSERRRIFAVLFQDAAKYEDTVMNNIFLWDNAKEEVERTGLPEKTGREAEKAGRSELEKGQNRNGRREERLDIGHPQKGEEAKNNEEAFARKSLAETLVGEWASEGGKFPQGADTFLGRIEENGKVLSEGQWQQLLIARELTQPAQIRILDEPMASLDIFQQAKVYEQFMEEDEKFTTLMFSHHMLAVRRAKRIFVLEQGTIAEEGSHGQLMEKRGLYARMYETQAEA